MVKYGYCSSDSFYVIRQLQFQAMKAGVDLNIIIFGLFFISSIQRGEKSVPLSAQLYANTVV